MTKPAFCLTFALLTTCTLAGPAGAAQCGNDVSGFQTWKEEFKTEAVAAGLSAKAVSVLDAVKYDPGVIKLDRSQKPFKMSFEQFAKQRLSSGRVGQGRKRMKQHAALLSQI